MTGSSTDISPRQPLRPAAVRLVWITLGVIILFAAYFLIPTKNVGHGSDLPWLILALGIFAAVAALQIPAIVSAPYPIVRAVGTIAMLVSLYILIFARIYLSISLSDPLVFNRPLDTVTALYFTMTVFATVGFGDIVAQSNSTMLLVTFQMLLNLAVIGTLIRLVTTAAQHGVARRRGDRNPSL